MEKEVFLKVGVRGKRRLREEECEGEEEEEEKRESEDEITEWKMQVSMTESGLGAKRGWRRRRNLGRWHKSGQRSTISTEQLLVLTRRVMGTMFEPQCVKGAGLEGVTEVTGGEEPGAEKMGSEALEERALEGASSAGAKRRLPGEHEWASEGRFEEYLRS